jgi:DNA-binding CsgD family transcriptional regulator
MISETGQDKDTGKGDVMQDDPHIYTVSGPPAVSPEISLFDSDRSPANGFVRPQSRDAGNIYSSIVKTAFDFVPCTGCVLSVHDTSTQAVRVVSSYGLPPPLAGRAINALTRRLSAAVAIDLNVATAQQKTPILQANLLDNGDQKWMLSVVRNSKYWTFERRDVQTLLKLRAMFRTALRERVQATTLYRACWSVVEKMASGIALLHGDGTVAGINKTALSLLESGRGIGVSKGKLCCKDAANAMRLRQALEELATADDGECRAFIVEGEKSNELVQVNLIRLGASENILSGVSVAAFLTDPALFTGPTTEYLQTLYRLTRVEAEVVQLICQGYSPARAAEKLRISVHTVRGYLKAIFAKIGVNRQADIVRVVANAPHVLGAAGG